MSGMHLLPVYYTTTSTKRRKKGKKTKSLLAAEREHEKFLKKMGVGKSKGGRSSVGERLLCKQEVRSSILLGSTKNQIRLVGVHVLNRMRVIN